MAAACVALAIAAGAAGCAGGGQPPAQPEVVPSARPIASPSPSIWRGRGPVPDAAGVVLAWDRRRSRAWEHGDVDALRRLYAPGSTAGRRDVAALRAWRSRGVSLSGADLDLLAVRVLGRAPGEWLLVVTDRLRPPVAEVDGVRVRLPADLPSRQVVRLVRPPAIERAGEKGREPGWVVVSVRPAHSAAPPRRRGPRT